MAEMIICKSVLKLNTKKLDKGKDILKVEYGKNSSRIEQIDFWLDMLSL